MVSFLYTLVIFPLEEFIELSWLFVFKVFRNPVIAVLGVSAAVSVCTLPLYFIAEKHQQSERAIQKRLKPKIDNIKAAFSGDERYMMLSTYYRQEHYHPIYALRSSLGLLIQIPFFIAAYSYISNLGMIRGVSFLFIKDLGAPDAIIPIMRGEGVKLSLNVLPILMTLINCVAGAVYTKGLPIKEKVQIYGMALVFLVLLYNSPAGLVLYWTMNNIFSLIKNCLQKTKNAKQIIYRFLCISVLFLDIFLIFFHHGPIVKRAGLALVCSIIFLKRPLAKLYARVMRRINAAATLRDTGFGQRSAFIFSALALFLLTGFVIPSALIASSVQEFSSVDDYASPLPFVVNTIFQAAGIFLFWPTCFYFLFSKKVKMVLAVIMTLLSAIALIDTFIFPGNYGFLNLLLKFSDFSNPRFLIGMVNILSLFATIALFLFLLACRKKIILRSFQIIALIALAGFGAINIARIHTHYSEFATWKNNDRGIMGPVYTFSQNGKNVLFIMLDRAISGYIPYIFDEKPELQSAFSGFTWYPNCVSFGLYTVFGVPVLYGGYEYTPLEMKRRSGETLIEKHNEALLMLPKLFLDNGYSVTVTDPPYANYSWTPDLRIFDAYPEILAENVITDKYSDEWLLNTNSADIISFSSTLQSNLIRFSFFKIMPLVFRSLVYDKGYWLKTSDFKLTTIPKETIQNYAVLALLPSLTAITADDLDTLTMFSNDLTHGPAFLQTPDYVPAKEITNKGFGPFAHEEHYHVNIAALSLLGKWFSFLKENDVYDNTRIIIASDHGRDIHSDFPGNITLPDGNSLQAYTALLLVKDFNAIGDLAVDYTFMTNADAPLLTVKDIIPGPINPFTHAPLRSDKENGVTITTSQLWQTDRHEKYNFKIQPDEWLYVHDDIFEPGNWKKTRQ
jgi:YidC/Oxa1 family membrane protein insertase